MNTQPTSLSHSRTPGGGAQAELTCKNRHSGGFTLVELLVVIAIIGVLAALLIPGYKLMMKKAQGSQCASSLRQIFMASESYSMDNNGRSLPGSKYGNSDFWLYLLRPYLGGASMWDDKVDAGVRCRTYKKGSNYWAWGYGMNSRPGYIGTATTAYDDDFNWEGVSYGRAFQSVNITFKSRRLFISDATEWQVTPAGTAAGVASFPDYNRHGTGACNVLFYDGHVESLKSPAINQALFDPGKM